MVYVEIWYKSVKKREDKQIHKTRVRLWLNSSVSVDTSAWTLVSRVLYTTLANNSGLLDSGWLSVKKHQVCMPVRAKRKTNSYKKSTMMCYNGFLSGRHRGNRSERPCQRKPSWGAISITRLGIKGIVLNSVIIYPPFYKPMQLFLCHSQGFWQFLVK